MKATLNSNVIAMCPLPQTNRHNHCATFRLSSVTGAADYVNIKITKSGLLDGVLMATAAKTAGLHVMMGGMVETRVAMGCSYSIAMGIGGCSVLDLDTPLLLKTDPVIGGYSYEGPLLQPWHGPGLDLDIPSFRTAVSDGL